MSKVTLGRLVQQSRQKRGMSQHELAKAAGISVPYLQRLESGEYETFPKGYLESVAGALGIGSVAFDQALNTVEEKERASTKHLTADTSNGPK